MLKPEDAAGEVDMFVKQEGKHFAWTPGENMVIRRLPCVSCGATPVRYIERRLCVGCYQRRAKRTGLGRLSDVELFTLWTAPLGECLAWLGHISPQGYGKFRMQYAHRFSYEEHVGRIPDGLVIDHLCMNKWCVRPSHLEPVTNAENVRRAAATITHCPKGHEYGDGNPRGKCHPCSRDRMRERSARQRGSGSTPNGDL